MNCSIVPNIVKLVPNPPLKSIVYHAGCSVVTEIATLPASKADIYHRKIGVVKTRYWNFPYYAGFYHQNENGDIHLTDDDYSEDHRWRTKANAEEAALQIAIENGAYNLCTGS